MELVPGRVCAFERFDECVERVEIESQKLVHTNQNIFRISGAWHGRSQLIQVVFRVFIIQVTASLDK